MYNKLILPLHLMIYRFAWAVASNFLSIFYFQKRSVIGNRVIGRYDRFDASLQRSAEVIQRQFPALLCLTRGLPLEIRDEQIAAYLRESNLESMGHSWVDEYDRKVLSELIPSKCLEHGFVEAISYLTVELKRHPETVIGEFVGICPSEAAPMLAVKLLESGSVTHPNSIATLAAAHGIDWFKNYCHVALEFAARCDDLEAFSKLCEELEQLDIKGVENELQALVPPVPAIHSIAIGEDRLVERLKPEIFLEGLIQSDFLSKKFTDPYYTTEKIALLTRLIDAAYTCASFDAKRATVYFQAVTKSTQVKGRFLEAYFETSPSYENVIVVSIFTSWLKSVLDYQELLQFIKLSVDNDQFADEIEGVLSLVESMAQTASDFVDLHFSLCELGERGKQHADRLVCNKLQGLAASEFLQLRFYAKKHQIMDFVLADLAEHLLKNRALLDCLAISMSADICIEAVTPCNIYLSRYPKDEDGDIDYDDDSFCKSFEGDYVTLHLPFDNRIELPLESMDEIDEVLMLLESEESAEQYFLNSLSLDGDYEYYSDSEDEWAEIDGEVVDRSSYDDIEVEAAIGGMNGVTGEYFSASSEPRGFELAPQGSNIHFYLSIGENNTYTVEMEQFEEFGSFLQNVSRKLIAAETG